MIKLDPNKFELDEVYELFIRRMTFDGTYYDKWESFQIQSKNGHLSYLKWKDIVSEQL